MSDIVKRLRAWSRVLPGVSEPNPWLRPEDTLSWEAAAEITRLRERVAELEGALRFYAEPWKYTNCHGDDVHVPDFYNELDFGETARAALGRKE